MHYMEYRRRWVPWEPGTERLFRLSSVRRLKFHSVTLLGHAPTRGNRGPDALILFMWLMVTVYAGAILKLGRELSHSAVAEIQDCNRCLIC